MKTKDEINTILENRDFLKQDIEVQEQILKLCFGDDYKKYPMQHMLIVLERYRIKLK